jgi:hypothetical protein
MSEWTQMKKPDCSGYVVLGQRPGQNSYVGIYEGSFSLHLSEDQVRFWWTGKGTDNLVGAEWDVDGKKDAERIAADYRKGHPNIVFTVWDITDPNLPIEINWDQWREASMPSDKTLSGVKNKGQSRNPFFRIPEERVSEPGTHLPTSPLAAG